MNIAIIGAGLAGSNILKTIVEHDNFNKDSRIHIFEKKNELGPGLPYEEDTKYNMLNVSPHDLSMEEDKYHFKNWLDENYEDPYNFENMVSRQVYGKYVKEYFEPNFSHPSVVVHKQQVKDIDIYGQKPNFTYKLKTDNWLEEEFDTVFLALGHPIYNDHYDLEGEENFIYDPYPMKEKLSVIPKDARVGIIGSGPSGVDAFRFLLKDVEIEEKFYFLVRSSIIAPPKIEFEKDLEDISFSISDQWIDSAIDKESGFLPLEKIIDLITKDMRKEKINLYLLYKELTPNTLEKYAEMIDDNRQDLAIAAEYFRMTSPYLARMYNLLTKEDQDNFNENYGGIFKTFYSVTPEKTTSWIINEVNKDKVEFVLGLEEISVEDGKFKIKADKNLTLDYLINTTGFNVDLKANAKHDDLIKNLYDKKIIMGVDKASEINITWPQGKVLSNKFGEIDTLYNTGMLSKSLHFQPNSARSIRVVSRNVANMYMEDVYLKLQEKN